jgi:hypothetical protein
MTEQDGHRENAEQGGQTGERWAGTPRWVRISLIIAGLLIALLVIQFVFGGDHGPARHLP